LLLKDLLKQLRESRGLNKQELANKVDISHSYISTIESGKVEKPTRKTLMKIAYVFDPEGEKNIYKQLLESSGHNKEGAEEEFSEYIFELNKSFKDNNKFNPSLISEMKYRVSKSNKNVVFLDKPYMNILWLLEQEDYEVYLGYEEDEVLIDENGYSFNKPLILDEEDKRNLLGEVNNFQSHLIFTKQLLKEKKERTILLQESKEYSLIFDLLNNDVEDEIQLIERLASIDKNREIFRAKEYYEEIRKAVKNKNAIDLQKLIKMKKIKELQDFLINKN